jgi:hypothetical protein
MRTQNKDRRGPYGKKLRNIIEDYRIAHHTDEWTMEAVAEWAIETGRYQRRPRTLLQQCKEDLSRAAQHSLYRDPQGREVRRLHPVKLFGEGSPVVIWGDLTTAKGPHMHVSQQQGRQAIQADVFRHKDVTDSFNDNNRHGDTVTPSDYNFNLDIAERDQPNEYPEHKPK